MTDEAAAIWRRLEALAKEHRIRDPRAYIQSTQELDERILQVGDLTLDWSLQRVDSEVLRTLLELADAVDLHNQLKRQFAGEVVNVSEQRAVLHTAMRGTPSSDSGFNARVQASQTELKKFAEEVLRGDVVGYRGMPFTDVLHIGIGGSHFGQRLLCDALPSTRLNFHFLSASHPSRRDTLLSELDPATTLIIVASKSFTTPETQQNFGRVQHWFAEHSGRQDALGANLVLIASDPSRLAHLAGRHFLVPKEVGGRFSVWSAMGLPILLALGPSRFDELLAGARQMDEHATTAPYAQNAPVILALLALWNTNFIASSSHAVLSYIAELRLLATYLQQLEMESLGKSVTSEGTPLEHHSTSVIWGGEETDGQHAWHQWLHQGTHAFTADYIVSASRHDPQVRWNLANGLAQHHVTFLGHDTDVPEKRIAGGKGATLIVLGTINAQTIGMLLALYEHKVSCLASLWGVNAFDQWGVEFGKGMAEEINDALVETGSVPADTLLAQRIPKILPSQN